MAVLRRIGQYPGVAIPGSFRHHLLARVDREIVDGEVIEVSLRLIRDEDTVDLSAGLDDGPPVELITILCAVEPEYLFGPPPEF